MTQSIVILAAVSFLAKTISISFSLNSKDRRFCFKKKKRLEDLKSGYSKTKHMLRSQ
jgi:hypothetical protein